MAALYGLAMVVLMVVLVAVQGSDPETLKDFEAPAGGNRTKLSGSFFRFSGLRAGRMVKAGELIVKKASLPEFPALRGLGVSYASLTFGAGSVNPPHIHPRGTEVLYVLKGWLEVGLIDSTNKIFTKKLQSGDVFVFPRGLVHYQQNNGKYSSKAISAFSSSNSGTISVPISVFGSHIPTDVLAKSFKVSPMTIKALKAPYK